MTERYKNRYRSASARARWWNYNKNGVYFVTIRTMGQDRCFGEVVNDQVILSKIGQIAFDTWNLSPEYFMHTKLDFHIVIPDHLHGIIMILKAGSRRPV